ncbi:clustered mitochondria protein homolog [Limulus polyphemus]|uniref:Clustered mitochondria protein homolog n=1 Tax=Limulus polyphemus TaxID=6850 RepID=A0ABM1TJ93_LIMPO|nr:clustered mitochondria protein homolog [Limulus polyphemus]XP_022255947.1 clustered mitochondria protein homolog [Limulus polyphemus]XP_022255948.1 clustered mitochondria protein homolog [Limulus polyphemus]XP_022255949.1 clustered mitochondria protein homolog [Limulus polyphemus]
MVKDSGSSDPCDPTAQSLNQEKNIKSEDSVLLECTEVSVSDNLTNGPQKESLSNGHGPSTEDACGVTIINDSMNGHLSSSLNEKTQLSINGKSESGLKVNGYIEEDIDDDDETTTQPLSKLIVKSKSPEKDTNGVTEKSESLIKLEDNSKQEQEFVFIQDTGFTVKIAAPGLEPFDVQVSSAELVQEIHQLLMDREDTCHRTCFSLQLDGITLDNFAELKNIEGLKEGSVIKVVEEPYTMREARIHVRHVRDLLKSLDPADAYNGVDCSSLSFLNVVTQGDILEKKKSRPDSVDCTPPDYIMPGSKERPLVPHQPQAKEQKGPQALKVLTTSGWNPPPGIRKLHGDLLYLYVATLEDKRVFVTASTRGFYVNQ